MVKITTSTYLTSNLEIKTIVRARDEHGRFIKGESPKTVKTASFDVARVVNKKAQTSTSIKQFQSRIRYVIGDKSQEKINRGYEQILDTVIDSGIGDKDKAKFFLVMDKLGPSGFDDLYNKYPEYIDSMYDYYRVEKDDEIKFISNRKQKMHRMLNGTSKVKGFFNRVGFSDNEIEKELTDIAMSDFRKKYPNPTDKQIDQFKHQLNRNPNFIYSNYLDNHYNDVFDKLR